MANGQSTFFVFATFLLLVAGCRDTASEDANDGDAKTSRKLQVLVVNYPLQYFAERIGGTAIDVAFPAPIDCDPAYWLPNAQAVTQYQSADLILLNGAGYASWTATASLPDSKLVNTASAVSDQYIQLENTITHTHGPGGEHAHGSTAITTWLDLDLAKAQATAIAEALKKAQPTNAVLFDQNLADLVADLRSLDTQLERLVANEAARPVLFSHPVYQYLARRYKLNGRSVHWEPDEPPRPEQWTELESILKEHAAHWMIWEQQPLEETEKQLQEMGVASVVFHPCGNRPVDGDFLSVMRSNCKRLEQAYQ